MWSEPAGIDREAKPLLREAVAQTQKFSGRIPREYARPLTRLGELLLETGRFADAEFALLDARHTPPPIARLSPDQIIVLFEVRWGRELSQLLPLARHPLDKVAHLHGAWLVRGGEERGRQHGVLDVPSRQGELARQKGEIQVVAERCLRRKRAPPDQLAMNLVRKRKLDVVIDPALEGVVEVLLEIRRQDHKAVVFLDLSQQIGDPCAVMRVLHIRSLC